MSSLGFRVIFLAYSFPAFRVRGLGFRVQGLGLTVGGTVLPTAVGRSNTQCLAAVERLQGPEKTYEDLEKSIQKLG